uniref:Uncharacterized protein n=1 Tax=Cacopsylla melanoneura TaxID=428564 RepID=A0A8D9B6P5_9HEMI
MALYYDRFNSFLTTIDALFYQHDGRHGKTMRDLIERIRARPETPERLDEEIRQAFVDFEIFRKDFDKEGLLNVLVSKVVQFLEDNKEYLPMYASTERGGKTDSEGNLGKDKMEDLDEICCHFGVPERGYHLPHTEPVMGRALDCIPDLVTSEQVQENKPDKANRTQIEDFMCPGVNELGVVQENYNHELKTRRVLEELNNKKNKIEHEQNVMNNHNEGHEDSF